jgi:hypothetical protein
MEFKCIEIDNYGELIGKCSLAPRQYDPIGTEHRFGDIDYVLVSTTIDGSGGTMYFSRKKV